jgi:SAM-dependent methyltransferase
MGRWGIIKIWRTWFKYRNHKEHELPSSEALANDDPQVSIQPGAMEEYHPNPGQPGKDVEWVPASSVVIKSMFEIAKVDHRDYVIDPGSGDGRMVISAAKLGANAMGIEFNPKMVELSKKNAAREGVDDKTQFIQADFFEVDFSNATVLTLFLREDINIALRSIILNMKPGARIVSNIFHMRDWIADEVVKVEDENYYFKNHTIYFWIVPAKVGGIWVLPEGKLTLEQSFQMLTGILELEDAAIPVTGKMTGDHIDFIADSTQYSGRVTGNVMELETSNGSNILWKATISKI